MEDLLTVKDVAERLKLKDTTIQKWIREGKLSRIIQLPGGDYRIPKSVVDDLIKNGLRESA